MQAVFLDRDGVINENRMDHVKSWTDFRFLPGAPEAIARLARAGVKVFVITNQAIVNRGVVPQQTVDAINLRMVRELEARGGRIELVAYCPHRPEEQCGCRKPKPGLLLRIAWTYGVDLGDAVVIGDALSDIEAGRAAGCRTCLVLTGRGRQQLAQADAAQARALVVAPDLSAAVALVLRQPAGVA